jgi:hypothetical protein
MLPFLRFSRWFVFLFAFVLAAGLPCQATEGVVKHHATLRNDPSTAHKPLQVVQAGEDVEILDPAPTHNYYHVRTSEGTEGWIFAGNIEILAETPPSTGGGTTPPPTGTHPGVASVFSPTWDKPVPPQTTFVGPDGECGPTGDGGDTFTNLRKNRTDAAPSYHEVTWKAIQSLPYPNAAKSLAQWTPAEMAQIQPYEGVPVTVVGYIVKIKVEDGGAGESTNCHFANPDEVDWHVPFAEHTGDAEATSVVIETTPRIRKSHPNWTPEKLASWVGSQAPVRVSGWTLFDPEHRAHLGKFRSTLWEVHPVIKIEVFKNGQWVDADTL